MSKDLINFETRKFWRSKKTAAVIVFIAVALGGMVFHNSQRNSKYWPSNERWDWESYIAYSECYRIRAEQTALEVSDPDNSSEKERLAELHDFYNTQRLYIYQLELLAKDYSPEKLEKRLTLEIQRDEHLLAGLGRGYAYAEQLPAFAEQRLAANKYCLEQGVEPPYSPYEMTGTNFISSLLSYPWVLIILIALALLNIDLFSGEFDGGAFKVLYAQPFRRRNIYFAKYAVHTVYSFVVVSSVILLVFALLSGINGLGDMRQPLFYYGQSFQGLTTADPTTAATGIFTFLPWTAYMARALPLYLLFVVLTVTVTATASLLLYNTANVLNFAASLLFIDVVFRTLFSVRSNFYYLWPFTGFEMNGALQGEFPLSPLAYLIAPGILSVCLFTVALIVLGRRDLSGGIEL